MIDMISKFRFGTLPLLLAGLREDGEIYEKTSAHFYAMARACMGPDIQLHSWIDLNGFVSVCFSWCVPGMSLYYTVTIQWEQRGMFLKPDAIITAVTTDRPRQKKEGLWSSGLTGHSGITDLATRPDSPEEDLVKLASGTGHMKFLRRRFFSFTHRDLRSKLHMIAKEYEEEFRPFMVAAIFAVELGEDDGGTVRFHNIALPLVRRVYPQLIAQSLVGVQPMASPSRLVYYTRYRASANKRIKDHISWFKKFIWRSKALPARIVKWSKLQLIKLRLKRPGPSWLVRESDLEITGGSWH